MFLGQDIRLASLLLLNAAVIAAGIYAAARWTRDPLQRLIDVLLWWYVVQYVAVGLPGLLGFLSPLTMACTALLLCAALALWARRRPGLRLDESHRGDHALILMGALAIVGMVGTLIFHERLLPVFDYDALTYHIPAAVQWLQRGRIGLFPVWFFNPFNTWSPLGGSTFIYWLLAPMRGDVLVRFVQAPPVLLLWAAMLQLGRLAGVRTLPALLCAFAVVSRPACSELIAPRDDLFLSAFVLVGVVAAGRGAVQDAAGPWRLGAALGLMLATKYTALMSVPLFLLLLDAPIRAAWTRRRWLLAASVVIALAGPWYLRNLWLKGNPLFPMRLELLGHTVLPGLFAMRVSQTLRSAAGIRHVVVGGFHGFPARLLVVLLVEYAAALVLAAHRWRDPIVRACLFGPLLCAALIFARSPYGDVRYLYPAFFIACAACGLPTARWAHRLRPWQQAAWAAPLAAIAIWTSYGYKAQLFAVLAVAAALAAAGYGLLRIDRRWPAWRRGPLPLGLTAVLLALALWTYVTFDAYVGTTHLNEAFVWRVMWPAEFPGWRFVHENVPADATIAYSQAFRIYPLMGDELKRRVAYVPVRPDVPDFLHHPGSTRPLTGDELGDGITAMTNAPADEAVWRQRLAATGAQYLFIWLGGEEHRPPELAWADSDPSHFAPLFRDKNTAIYQIRQ